MPLLEQVLENNPETVKIVLKNMPLRFHKQADPAARAALAGGMQGKYWEFHDRLFLAEKLDEQVINTIAQELGLDMARFAKDMASPAVRQQINRDLRDAQIAGVTGTPTVFVNGRKVKNRSLQGFQALINDALKKTAQQ